MKRTTRYIFLISILAAIGFSAWWFWPRKLILQEASFSQLPGWNKAKLKQSLLTFQVSCKVFLKQDPEKLVGNQRLNLKVKDWHPACRAALEINPVTNENAKAFFQKWFKPVTFYSKKPVRGLFTGYYMPSLQGSLVKTKEFSVPIYGTPSDLLTIDLGQFDASLKHRTLVGRLKGHKIVPYPTRSEINKGAIKDKAPVLVWIKSKIDRVFLEIQGSGIVELPDGKSLYLGYDAQNGAPYTAIAKVLIDKGVMTRDSASMQAIKHYLVKNPDQIDSVLNQNKSFVFFSLLPANQALGTQGVPLTPGYSLAIDRSWIPLGTPLWLNTTRPDKNHDDKQSFQRLLIAQDTGGAIKGSVRGDVFWGAGKKATFIAGHMKNPGYYWLFLPHHTVERLKKEFS